MRSPSRLSRKIETGTTKRNNGDRAKTNCAFSRRRMSDGSARRTYSATTKRGRGRSAISPSGGAPRRGRKVAKTGRGMEKKGRKGAWTAIGRRAARTARPNRRGRGRRGKDSACRTAHRLQEEKDRGRQQEDLRRQKEEPRRQEEKRLCK
jgi:hypothetical protein